MDINGKQLTAVSLEQLRALSERIKEAKAGAIGNMKSAAEAMHEQGRLLIQAEMELGEAFDAFVDSLANEGIDPNQARYNIKLAKKHKEVRSLFTDPSAAKQLVLQNFAPPTPPKPVIDGGKTSLPFSLSFHLNIDPLDWSEEIKRDFMAKAKPVVQLVQEIEG